MTDLPPDEPLLALAALLKTLLPAGAAVNFFRVQHDDGRQPQTGIVYQYGPHRATVLTEGALTEADAPEIVAGVNDWVEARRYAGRWTEDPNEAA